MMKTEQQSAREELLAVLDTLLGDGKVAPGPESLAALHNVAIAAREYLQAEQAAEAPQPETPADREAEQRFWESKE